MPGPIQNRALYQEVADRLRHLIYSGELSPGSWIDERALVAKFAISRTPLREALKVLHSEGLVRLTPRRGSFVAGELTPQDLDEIFPLMSMLEGLCATEAVRKASRADLLRLEGLHAALERHAAAGDVDRYYEVNQAFHGALQDVAANPWLSRTVGDLRRFLRLLRGRQLRVPGRLRASLEEHRRLMRALRRGDADAAERAMRDHIMAQRAALSLHDAPPPARRAPPPPKRARAGRRPRPASPARRRG